MAMDSHRLIYDNNCNNCGPCILNNIYKIAMNCIINVTDHWLQQSLRMIIYDNRSRIKCQHYWGGIYDHLTSRLIFTLMLKHIFILAQNCEESGYGLGLNLLTVSYSMGVNSSHNVQTNMSSRRGIVWGISIYSIHKGDVLFFSSVHI